MQAFRWPWFLPRTCPWRTSSRCSRNNSPPAHAWAYHSNRPFKYRMGMRFSCGSYFSRISIFGPGCPPRYRSAPWGSVVGRKVQQYVMNVLEELWAVKMTRPREEFFFFGDNKNKHRRSRHQNLTFRGEIYCHQPALQH